VLGISTLPPGVGVGVGVAGVGVGVVAGVAVGEAVPLGVVVGMGVGVGVGVAGDCSQYLPPVFTVMKPSVPPQTIISLPVHTAV
jgi:hypothetical protein